MATAGPVQHFPAQRDSQFTIRFCIYLPYLFGLSFFFFNRSIFIFPSVGARTLFLEKNKNKRRRQLGLGLNPECPGEGAGQLLHLPGAPVLDGNRDNLWREFNEITYDPKAVDKEPSK